VSDDLGTARLSTEVDLAGLEKGLNDARTTTESRMSGMAAGLSGALGLAFAGAGVAVAGGLVTAVNAAGDFESAVNNLAAVSGDALAQAGFSFDDVSQKALNLGQTTAFSASQSIAAMTELVKGGVPIADVMDMATEATLTLAAAGQLELASAAEIVAKQLGVWGDQGVTATQVTDLLAAAANASTVGVEELAAGLANAQGTAETAGVEYQDLVQTMALLAPNFASADTAGTSLNNFLLRIQPTTDAAKTAMADLGLLTFNTTDAMEYLANEGVAPLGDDMNTLASQIVELQLAQGASTEEAMNFAKAFETSAFYDAAGQFVGMEEAAELLQGSMEGLSEAEKTMALQTIFGNDAMGAAVALAGAGSEGFNAMGEAMDGAGTAAEVAAVQNQGLNFAMDSMMGSIETLSIIVGTLLVPVLTDFINNVITPAIGGLSTLTQALSGNAEAFNLLPGPVQAIITAIQGMAAMMQGEGVASLGAWSGAFDQARVLIEGVMTGVMAIVQPILAQLSAFWAQHGAEITAFASQAWNQIGTIVAGVLEILNATVIPVLAGIGQFISAHGADIQAILGAAWGNIQAVVSGALGFVQGIVNAVLAAIRGDWDGAWAGLNQATDAAVNAIRSVIENTLNLIATLWSNNGDEILAVAEKAWGQVRSTIEGIVPGIQAQVSAVIAAAGSIGRAIIDGIVSGIRGGIDIITDAARNVAQMALQAAKQALGIASPSKLFAEQVGKPISQGVAEGILANVAAATNAARDMGDEVLDEIADTADRARALIDEVMSAQIGLRRGTSSSYDILMDAQAGLTKAEQDRAKVGEQLSKAQAEQAARAEASARKLADLEAERAALAESAAFNSDPARRADAAEQLIAVERAIADEQREAAEQQAAAAAKVAELAQANEDANARYVAAADRAALAQQLLTEAQAKMAEYAKEDPALGREFLQLRQSQIKELLDLQEDYDSTTEQGTRELIAEQIRLIQEAQALELQEFERHAAERAAEYDTEVTEIATGTDMLGVPQYATIGAATGEALAAALMTSPLPVALVGADGSAATTAAVDVTVTVNVNDGAVTGLVDATVDQRLVSAGRDATTRNYTR
jgi:phage-related protein